jgi:hypothetical protein
MPISYSDGQRARRSRSLPHQLLCTAKSMYIDGETHIRSPKFGNMPRPPKMPICAQYIPLSSSGWASMTAAIVSGRPDCFRPIRLAQHRAAPALTTNVRGLNTLEEQEYDKTGGAPISEGLNSNSGPAKRSLPMMSTCSSSKTSAPLLLLLPFELSPLTPAPP